MNPGTYFSQKLPILRSEYIKTFYKLKEKIGFDPDKILEKVADLYEKLEDVSYYYSPDEIINPHWNALKDLDNNIYSILYFLVVGKEENVEVHLKEIAELLNNKDEFISSLDFLSGNRYDLYKKGLNLKK